MTTDPLLTTTAGSVLFAQVRPHGDGRSHCERLMLLRVGPLVQERQVRRHWGKAKVDLTKTRPQMVFAS